jgi:rubrerythrin
MVEGGDSISGKQPEKIMEKMVSKLISIKLQMIERYILIKQSSKMSNTIQILEEMITLEEKDIELLKNAETLENVMYSRRTGNEEDYGAMDHMIVNEEQPSSDDPRSILAWTIKQSDIIYKIAEILLEEYEDDKIKKLLGNIAESEMKRKNRITELYDEVINKNDW